MSTAVFTLSSNTEFAFLIYKSLTNKAWVFHRHGFPTNHVVSSHKKVINRKQYYDNNNGWKFVTRLNPLKVFSITKKRGWWQDPGLKVSLFHTNYLPREHGNQKQFYRGRVSVKVEMHGNLPVFGMWHLYEHLEECLDFADYFDFYETAKRIQTSVWYPIPACFRFWSSLINNHGLISNELIRDNLTIDKIQRITEA